MTQNVCEIYRGFVLCKYIVPVKFMVEISQTLVAFSEYMNYPLKTKLLFALGDKRS